MTPVAAHFDAIERLLLISKAVARFTELNREALSKVGQLRVRAELLDGGVLEFFEYVMIEPSGLVRPVKYSYHWQDANRQLVRRWDNVKHHLELPNAPHHVHRAGGQVEGVQPPPDLETVLKEIEGYLGINS